MRIKLDNPSLLSKLVEIISELVTEVRIKINSEGMSITAMDPANVSMVTFKIFKSSFSEFETGNEALGINLDNLKQILKRCGVGSSLIMESQENFLKIIIQDKIKRIFTLNLIEVESEDINFQEKIANMEFVSEVELYSGDFVAAIEDCHVVSDACSFVIQDGKFIIEAKSLNSAMSEFSNEQAKINAENCRAKYSIEYLGKFMKGAKMSVKTVLNFASDYPLKMSVTNEQMELTFILAPRVETDD